MKSKGIISKKQGSYLGIFLISLFMTAVMSLGMLVAKSPHDPNFFKSWLSDFLLGCLIAIPAGYVLVPSINKVMDLISKNE